MSARPIRLFVLVTYATTWACFFAAGAVSRNQGPTILQWGLLLVGAFMPSTVAIIMTWREEGTAGVKALLRRLREWRVGVKWWAFALGFMLAVKVLVAASHRMLVGAWPAYHGDAWYAILAALPFAAILGGPLGEEIGWRGYALPRLADRYGLARAAVILGIVWALWHLPVFFIAGLDQFGQSFPVYALRVTALSVAMAWLSGNTGGSVLLAVAMHAAINQSKDIASSVVPGASNPFTFAASLDGWLTVLFCWIFAGYFLARMTRGARAAPQTVAAQAW